MAKSQMKQPDSNSQITRKSLPPRPPEFRPGRAKVPTSKFVAAHGAAKQQHPAKRLGDIWAVFDDVLWLCQKNTSWKAIKSAVTKHDEHGWTLMNIDAHAS